MENYFTVDAIKAIMKGQMPDTVTLIASDKPVGQQLGFEVKNNGGRIAREMSLEDIKGTDLESFLQHAVSMLTTKGHVQH